MKQTAVEWLESKLKNVEYNPLEKNGYSIAEERLFNQAKEMEKQQIENAFDEGMEEEYQYHINNEDRENAEQYYNEQFKNK